VFVRSGFAPGEALPGAYAGFAAGILRDRVAGKWNVQAVVATADDADAMLAHTALQAHRAVALFKTGCPAGA
jgi:hypothetical protein